MISWSFTKKFPVFLIWIIMLFAYSDTSHTSCDCALDNNTLGDSSGDIRMLHCGSISSIQPIDMYVPCFRLGDLVRIGPIEGTRQNISTVNLDRNLKVAPWGFASLLSDDSIRVLQLEINMTRHEVNALSLAGAENLHAIQARTNSIYWDTCAFFNLPKLKNLLLSCKSNYNDFLTLGPGIDLVRFVDCEDVPLQFHCWNCLQNTSVNVIRIRHGPPLRKFMVRFSDFHTEHNIGTDNRQQQLSIGKCIPRMCSDDMLCRNNDPLRILQEQITLSTIISERLYTSTSSIVSTITPQLANPTTSSLTFPFISKSTLAMTTVEETTFVKQNATETTDHRIAHLANKNVFLSNHTRIWIAVTIISVIIGLMVTVCVIGRLRSHRRRTERIKFHAGQPCATQNGCLIETLPETSPVDHRFTDPPD